MFRELLAVHGKTSILSLLVIGAVSAGILLSTHDPSPPPVLDIAVEHATPLRLGFAIASGKGRSIIELNHDGAETVGISVPQGWKRTEVRGAPIEAFMADEPTFGFVRWSLPPKAGIAFQAEATIERVVMHNPSGVPLQVRLTRVDLEKGTAAHETILIPDSPTQLW